MKYLILAVLIGLVGCDDGESPIRHSTSLPAPGETPEVTGEHDGVYRVDVTTVTGECYDLSGVYFEVVDGVVVDRFDPDMELSGHVSAGELIGRAHLVDEGEIIELRGSFDDEGLSGSWSNVVQGCTGIFNESAGI